LVPAASNLALDNAAADGPRVLCSLDPPTVQEDGAVAFRVWSSASAKLTYAWDASAGEIQGSGPEARWSVAGVAPGVYRATVQVRGADLNQSCAVRLVVTQVDRAGPPPLETARGFLTAHDKETSGYGLYSYLLLGAPPTESNRERYLKVVAAFLKLVPSIEQLKQNVRIQEINAAYALVDDKVPASVSAAWLLDHYDYPRARAILRLLPGNLRDGPYFVSSLTPLTGERQLPAQYLFQNLSAVPTQPDDLASWWVREFMNQAAQERFWDAHSVSKLALNVRTTIAIMSAGLPEVAGHWASGSCGKAEGAGMARQRWIAIAIFVAASFSVPPAQGASWEQLHEQVGALAARGQYQQMLAAALEALRAAEETYGINHVNTAVSTYEVALAYESLGQLEQAETFYRRALTLEERTFGPAHPETLKCLNNLAALYSRTGRKQQAEPLYLRVIRAGQSSNDLAINTGVAVATFNLAEQYAAENKFQAAIPLYQQSLALVERAPTASPLTLDYVLYRLAHVP
jgi:tetratricopeptide (TPR) repeat protein